MAEVCPARMCPNRGSWPGLAAAGLRLVGSGPPRWPCGAPAVPRRLSPDRASPHGSHHRVVACDTAIENLLGGQPPPVLGENLNFRRPGVARRLDPTTDLLQFDDAVTHHAAIVEEIARRQ